MRSRLKIRPIALILLSSSALFSGAAHAQFASSFNVSGVGSTVAGFQLLGAAASDTSGYSVSNVGDVNGDGKADLIVSSPDADPSGRSNAGTSYLIYGGASLTGTIDLASLSSSQGLKILGAVSTDNSGWAVSGAGDVNGDGKADLIVGATKSDPSSRSNAGSAYIIYGSASFGASLDLNTLSSAAGVKIFGSVAGDNLGYSVSSAGDVNADGKADIIVGAINADPSSRSNAGAAYIIYGSNSLGASIDTSSMSSSTGVKLFGAVAGDNAGFSVSGAGDVNGDGKSDVLVGSYLNDPSGRTNAGAAYVVYGGTSMGASIDLNSLSSAQGVKVLGAIAGEHLGSDTADLGDINADGKADFLVSAEHGQNSANSITTGRAYIVYGGASLGSTIDLASASLSQAVKIFGANYDGASSFGKSISKAGDINGDGFLDIIVGAPLYDAAGGPASAYGASYVIYGRSSFSSNIDTASLPVSSGFRLDGVQSGGQVGNSVSGGGDINGDGLSDMIIGAYSESPSGRASAGTSYIVYGQRKAAATIGLGSGSGTFSTTDPDSYLLDFGDITIGTGAVTANLSLSNGTLGDARLANTLFGTFSQDAAVNGFSYNGLGATGNISGGAAYGGATAVAFNSNASGLSAGEVFYTIRYDASGNLVGSGVDASLIDYEILVRANLLSAEVPAPASMGLVLAALWGMGKARRRKAA